jgi:SAM-dependent methyltransferase
MGDAGVTQRTSGLYHLTQLPWFYEGFQRALGATRARREIAESYLRPKRGERFLDLGCGPAGILPMLGEVDYVGIDLNAAHIETARATYGARGRFHCGDFASLQGEMANSCAIVMCYGLLHHLDDERVSELAGLARSYLLPGGRFVAVDPVFHPGQPWIARQMAAADVGQCVREAKGYERLVGTHFGSTSSVVRHDLLRIPYSYCVTIAYASPGDRKHP